MYARTDGERIQHPPQVLPESPCLDHLEETSGGSERLLQREENYAHLFKNEGKDNGKSGKGPLLGSPFLSGGTPGNDDHGSPYDPIVVSRAFAVSSAPGRRTWRLLSSCPRLAETKATHRVEGLRILHARRAQEALAEE
jgi:hypothetical protein